MALQTYFASELHWDQMTWAESRRLVEFRFSGNGNGIFLRQCENKSLFNVEIVSQIYMGVSINRKLSLYLMETIN
jgi:hypothetical protein